MAIVNNMTTYDLNGKKLSFANWISNLSPTETPFVSMTGKEAISQDLFQWQTDRLPAVDRTNAKKEGEKVTGADVCLKTVVKSNVTQILRKVVQVSDTANSVAAYGRGKELQYQMEKAGNEIKRDLERAFLIQGDKHDGSSNQPRKTAGFMGQVSNGQNASNEAIATAHKDEDTGAKVAFKNGSANLREQDIFEMTYQLYIANSKANVIMFHPKHAAIFSAMQEESAASTRMRVFGSMEDKLNLFVDTIIDPLGQKFALIPNRHMPTDFVYFFNPSDWTQMVYRAPQRTKLAKEGSFEKWMIEMEVGLRHRNPYASGVLKIGV